MLALTHPGYKNKCTKNLIKAGRTLYGICLAALGIQQFQYADFRPVLVPEWPLWLHTPVLAYITGAALIFTGGIIIFSSNSKRIALVAGGIFLLSFICFHTIYQLFIIRYSFHLGLWTDALKELALSGGAFVIAGTFPVVKLNGGEKNELFRLLEKIIPAGNIFFSIMLISFGIDHFLYTENVSTLVPSWIPGHIFWTYFAAVALIGSGMAILFKILLTQVALLLAIMFLIWFVILHIPRAIADPHIGNGNEITSVFEALGFSGIALIIACMHKKKKR